MDDAIRSVSFPNMSYTATVGTEVGGTWTSSSVSISGEDEPDGIELASDRSQMRGLQKLDIRAARRCKSQLRNAHAGIPLGAKVARSRRRATSCCVR
jgi:hypothetical protein